ncbi:MAG: MFS transporter [Thermomicrobiales bacterium]|nr:MFS transporter [Thermomicrobiales bacterium]
MILSPESRARLPLFALLAANAVSMLGNVFALIAIPWYVLETTGSASQAGLTGFAAALPFIIAGVFGGALVDRVGFRRMSIVSDIISSVAVAAIPLMALTVGLAFWQLLVLVFIGGLLDTPGTTARMSLLPDLAERAAMKLERVNAIEQLIQRASYLLGAPIAGLVIAGAGVDAALWIDAASFLVSAALILCIPASMAREHEERRVTSGYRDDLRVGFDFIRRDGLILCLVVQVSMMNFIDAMIGLIIPVYAVEVYGSAASLGLMLAAHGAGAVVTTLMFAAVGHRMPRRNLYIASFVLAGVPLITLAFTPVLVLTLAALVVRGFGAGPLNPILMTVNQERVPPELRGRVFGVITSIAWLAIPIGRLLAGYLVEWAGLTLAIGGVAVIYVLAALSMLRVSALREMDLPPGTAARAGAASA